MQFTSCPPVLFSYPDREVFDSPVSFRRDQDRTRHRGPFWEGKRLGGKGVDSSLSGPSLLEISGRSSRPDLVFRIL